MPTELLDKDSDETVRLSVAEAQALGEKALSSIGYAPDEATIIATHLVDVEVDPDTGKVTVLRYTVVSDVGNALHPAYVEGQMQGAAVQGIGMGLTEEYFYDKEGTLRNSSLLDYRMPTTLDMPNIETILVEVPNPGHPLGVRGVGECSIVPPVGAIANALFDAIGIRMNDMPATPQRILDALLEKQGK